MIKHGLTMNGILCHNTGRISSGNPNLQNIPRVGPIKNMYVPRQSKKEPSVFVQLDLSQVELRVLAMLCADPTMCQVYIDDGDLHDQTTINVFGHTKESLDLLKVEDKVLAKEQRVVAKKTNFGVVYGSGAANLSQQLAEEGVTRSPEECQIFIDMFKKGYPGFPEWQDRMIEEAMKTGYVENPFGFRRPLPNIYSTDNFMRSEALRQVINTPIQGVASNMNMINLILVERYIRERKMDSVLNGIVHDSLTMELPIREVKEVVTQSLYIMDNPKEMVEKHFPYLNADWMIIPMKSDAEIGSCWGDVKEVSDIDKIEEMAWEFWESTKGGELSGKEVAS